MGKLSTDLATEVASNDERRALVAMRDVLAERMAEAEPNVVAQIAARLQMIVARLSELGPAVKQESASDDIARRREARRAAAQVAQAPAGGNNKQRRRSG